MSEIRPASFDLVTANGLYDLQEQRYATLLSLVSVLPEAGIRAICGYMGEPFTNFYHVKRCGNYTYTDSSPKSQAIVQVVPKPEGAKRRGTPENDIWLHIPLNEVSHPEAKSDPISFDWNFIGNCYVNIESLSIRGGHKHRKEKVP